MYTVLVSAAAISAAVADLGASIRAGRLAVIGGTPIRAKTTDTARVRLYGPKSIIEGPVRPFGHLSHGLDRPVCGPNEEDARRILLDPAHQPAEQVSQLPGRLCHVRPAQ